MNPQDSFITQPDGTVVWVSPQGDKIPVPNLPAVQVGQFNDGALYRTRQNSPNAPLQGIIYEYTLSQPNANPVAQSALVLCYNEAFLAPLLEKIIQDFPQVALGTVYAAKQSVFGTVTYPNRHMNLLVAELGKSGFMGSNMKIIGSMTGGATLASTTNDEVRFYKWDGLTIQDPVISNFSETPITNTATPTQGQVKPPQDFTQDSAMVFIVDNNSGIKLRFFAGSSQFTAITNP